MSINYDVVVIGAGLGGLSVATSLASSGRRVLLLERRSIPGGYASSFVRGRFEFEVALHALSGIGAPGARSRLHHYLESLGMTDHVEFVETDEIYRSIFPGLDITLPTGQVAFEQELVHAFPRERQGITTFFRRIDSLASDVEAYNNSGGRPNLAKMKNILRYLPLTVAQVLDRDVADPMARAVIAQSWGYYGLGPKNLSFMLFAMALRNYITNGVWYIKGRSQSLSHAFVNRIEEAGGDVLFSNKAEKITISGQNVTGVLTEHGDFYGADTIVANVNPIVTMDRLLGPDVVPQSYRKKFSFREPSSSTFNVYLGLVGTPHELGLGNYEIFLNESINLDEHEQRMRTLKNPAHVSVTTHSALIPEISPPGTTMTVLTSLIDGEPWYKLLPQEYYDNKQRIADSLMSMVEQTLCPSLRQAAEVISVSTPLTNIRYTNTIAGSIYGSSPYPHDSTVMRIPHKGPFKGLYFVGAWSARAGGFEPAMIDGEEVAQEIMANERH